MGGGGGRRDEKNPAKINRGPGWGGVVGGETKKPAKINHEDYSPTRPLGVEKKVSIFHLICSYTKRPESLVSFLS